MDSQLAGRKSKGASKLAPDLRPLDSKVKIGRSGQLRPKGGIRMDHSQAQQARYKRLKRDVPQLLELEEALRDCITAVLALELNEYGDSPSPVPHEVRQRLQEFNENGTS